MLFPTKSQWARILLLILLQEKLNYNISSDFRGSLQSLQEVQLEFCHCTEILLKGAKSKGFQPQHFSHKQERRVLT